MDDQSTINKEIIINVPPSKLWQMFSDPAFTRQMGGEYVSDWQEGSLLSWKATGGQVLTNGIILAIEPGKLLQHSLLHPDDTGDVMAVITYEMHEEDGRTKLTVSEEFTESVSENELTDAAAGWNIALEMIKKLIE